MITQSQLNVEIDLSKKIYLYYFDKMADNISIGSDKYIDWYKDLCIIYFLTKSLLSINIVDTELYIGKELISNDYFSMMREGIREYINYELRETIYTELDSHGNIKDIEIPDTPNIIIINNGFTQDWRSVVLNVTEDDINQLTLPFNISQVDPESIQITSSTDANPIQLVDLDEEGVTIVDSILYWHTYYNLKSGDKVFIQYLLNIE